jgi:hypothetical protein
MSADQTLCLLRLLAVLATTLTSCAREHGDRVRIESDGGASDAAATAVVDAGVSGIEPRLGSSATARPTSRVELIDDAQWPQGLWVGQGKIAVCSTQSQRVSIGFDASPDGKTLTGHIVFGDHEMIAPVDPAHGYPTPTVGPRYSRCERDDVYDGYPYPIRQATVWPNGRLTLLFSPSEMYDEWCVSQASYSGVPNGSFSGDDTEQWDHTCANVPQRDHRMCEGAPEACPIDFDKFHLCNEGYCHCTAAGCRADLSLGARLDLAISSETIDGVLKLTNRSPGAVLKLQRVE